MIVNASRCGLTAGDVYDGMRVLFDARASHRIPGCLRVVGGDVFLCSDLLNGYPVPDNDFRGFRYSWYFFLRFRNMSTPLRLLIAGLGVITNVYMDTCPKRRTPV